MKAKLKDLEGKYYGTWIEIRDNDDNPVGGLTLWLTPVREEDYKPSERELKAWDHMLKHDLSEEEVNSLTDEEKEYEISDNHYETVLTLKVANKIVEAINGNSD